MPADRAQSKALNRDFPSYPASCGNLAALPIMRAPPRRVILMPTRRTVILGAAIVVAAFGAVSAPPPLGVHAWAADASARAFVTDIYDAYKGKDAKGHPLDDERAIRRYFEPSLAALMVKDQKIAAKRGEVGLLDFDPFIDAQDWEISNFDIAVDDSAPGKASATVKFTNFDKAATVRLDLVKVKNDWRIADITWLRDGKAESLGKIYGR
jgi:hypothetical protein